MKIQLFPQALRRAVSAALLIVLTACSATPAISPTSTMTTTSTPPPPLPTPSPAAGTVEVWVTLGDQSKLLSRQPDLLLAENLPAAESAIQVNPQVLYQQFEGAGAAMTESSAYLIMSVLDSAARQQLMQDLFTRQGQGIGLSYLRLPLGASDFALRDYTYDDLPAGQVDPSLNSFSIDHDLAHVIPSLKLALELNPQLRLMGSPWSPPAWMKVNNQFHGSSMLSEYYPALADYLVRFVQGYAAQGITIDSLTPQNEPMYATEGYPTMHMPAAEQQAFVRDNLGPALQAAGLDTRLIVFDHNWDLVDYPLEVLADPAAAAFVDGVAFHCYGGDVSAQSRVHDQYPDKGIWFTECSGGEWAPRFRTNLSWNLRNLVIGNYRNWGNSTILWNLALDENAGPQNGGCGNCRGVVTIDQSSGAVTYNVEYYILGHVTKFIDPGAYRADSTAGGGSVPPNVAFLNPDGSLALVVQSDHATTIEVRWQGKGFSYRLPGAGAVTFRWNTGQQPGATATPLPYQTATPLPTLGASGEVPASPLLMDFEAAENPSLRSVSNAEAALGEIAHHGAASLLSQSSSGEWHIVGLDLAAQPLDLSGFQKICFWVYDTTTGDTGTANNTIGVRLVDSTGASEEHWTDHAGVGSNPRSLANEWVQMCLNLSAYPDVYLTNVRGIEFNTYWSGLTYFDEITVEGTAP